MALQASGCSMTFPMSSLMSSDPDTTGSIVTPASPRDLGVADADWVVAATALDRALDPQQNSAPARWANPETGGAGVFAAAGPAFVKDDRVCRLFKAAHGAVPTPASHLGTACRMGAGTWVLEKAKPIPEA